MYLTDLPELDNLGPEHFDHSSTLAFWDRYPDGVARSSRGLEILSYQLVSEGFRSTDLRNSTEAKLAAIGFTEGPVHDALAGMTTSTEGPEHRQMRRAFQPWFIADNVEKFRSDIRAAIDRWTMANVDGVADFAGELGVELPAIVFAQLVGADIEEAPFISRVSAQMLTFPTFDPAVHDSVEEGVMDTLRWLEELIKRKLDAPASDITSALLAAEREGTITRQHTLRILVTLIVASVDSTRAQMACNLTALARNKDQWKVLKQHPEAVSNAVPELYRYNPAVLSSSRYSERDLDFNGIQISAYTPVFLGVFHANNDPSIFDRPRELDVLTLRARPSLSFGNGRHSCVGRMVATIEQEELLSSVLEHWDDFDIAESVLSGAPFRQLPTTLTLSVTGTR